MKASWHKSKEMGGRDMQLPSFPVVAQDICMSLGELKHSSSPWRVATGR